VDESHHNELRVVYSSRGKAMEAVKHFHKVPWSNIHLQQIKIVSDECIESLSVTNSFSIIYEDKRTSRKVTKRLDETKREASVAEPASTTT
ncbi:hypothetical protein PENTCL1PPCAC_493, partial [Pristionchus entomophagus]